MLASIIMPFYNRVDLVHARMAEFYRFLPIEEVEIILVDDCSNPDEKADGLVGFWQKQIAKHKIRYLKNDKNMGFSYSMNRGASKANGDILIFFSDDVVVGGDFLAEVSYLLAGEDNVLVGGELLDRDTGWNTFKGQTICYLNGWFLACTKKAWEDLGGFDLRYGISDYEDIDLSLTATQKGFRLVPMMTSKLHHIGGQTAGQNPNREKRTWENQKLFREKWGL